MEGTCHETFVQTQGMDNMQSDPNVSMDGVTMTHVPLVGEVDDEGAVHLWRWGDRGSLCTFPSMLL